MLKSSPTQTQNTNGRYYISKEKNSVKRLFLLISYSIAIERKQCAILAVG